MIKNIIIGALALSSVGMVSANVNNNESVKNVLSDDTFQSETFVLNNSLNQIFYDENGVITSENLDSWSISKADTYGFMDKGYYFNGSKIVSIGSNDLSSILSGTSLVEVYNNVLDNLFVGFEWGVYNSSTQEDDFKFCYFTIRDFLKGGTVIFTDDTKSFTADCSVVNGVFELSYVFEDSTNDAFSIDLNTYVSGSSTDNGNIYVDGSNIHYVVNVSNPIKFSQIISSITAIDETDGNITSSITYETNYPTTDTITSLNIGSYPVSFSVSDSSGNTTNGTFTIDVIDITAPTLTNTSVDVSNTSLVSKDDIITRLGITDNYDSFDNLTISVSGYENYQTNYKKASTYPLTITCTDSSGNSETYSVNIYNADNIQPTFSVKNGSPFNLINGSLNTYLSSNFGISVSYLKSLLVATDETDNDITSSIIIKSDTYTGNEDKASKTPYEVVFSVADRSGNTTNLSVKIYVVDDIAPVVHFGADFYISTSNPITQVELANYLKNLYNVSTEASFVSVNSLYFEGDNSTIADTYACTVSYMSANNEVIETYSFNITTTTTESMQDSGEKQEESPKVDKEKVNAFVRFFKAIGRFFSNIGKSIARFFKKIF